MPSHWPPLASCFSSSCYRCQTVGSRIPHIPQPTNCTAPSGFPALSASSTQTVAQASYINLPQSYNCMWPDSKINLTTVLQILHHPNPFIPGAGSSGLLSRVGGCNHHCPSQGWAERQGAGGRGKVWAHTTHPEAGSGHVRVKLHAPCSSTVTLASLATHRPPYFSQEFLVFLRTKCKSCDPGDSKLELEGY